MSFHTVIGVIALGAAIFAKSVSAEEIGDPAKGQALYRACALCHSLAPGRHMTGPSLAGIFGIKAGTVEGFTRYSKALKEADIVWDEHTMDAWLANPRAFVPGNRMTFRGLSDKTQRRDLVAFLRSVSEETGPSFGQQEGKTGQGQMLDLKAIDANGRIASISHCGDTYTVTVESGESHEFWEFNLRFKTDGSENGPHAGQAILISGGMGGDRAFVVFAAPSEISSFITSKCPQ